MVVQKLLSWLLWIVQSVRSTVVALTAVAIFSAPAACLTSTPSPNIPNGLAIKIAVFSDDAKSFHDPRFTVADVDQLPMLAPIGHATTMDQVLLQRPDDTPTDDVGKRYGITSGTVFMVSPCIALTNYHVVFGQTIEQTGSARHDYRVKVSISGKTGVGIPFTWGDFARGPENDWAAIRVTPCIGRSVGWLSVTYTKQNLPREVTILGFYRDIDYSALAGQDCVLIEKSSSAKIWRTNCAIEHGTSGSPIGIFDRGLFRPTAMAFAMTRYKTQTFTYDSQDANFAIDLSKVFLDAPNLALTIANDVKAYALPNPANVPPDRQIGTPLFARHPVTSLRPLETAMPPNSEQGAFPPDPQPIGLPPDPKPIGLPPDPKAIGLPADPRLIRLPSELNSQLH